MAKLLLILALCLSSTFAVPNLKFSRGHLALTRVASQLKSVDSGFETCFESLLSNIFDTLSRSHDQMMDCNRDSVQELLMLQEEIGQISEVAALDLYAMILDFEDCGDDEACKVAAIKDMVDLIEGFLQELNDIVDRHLTSLAGKLPETAECLHVVNLALIEAFKTAESDFVACINA
ncbi:uncharacterized protein [Atheta coriaria]|uniref:uncharacterized protein n=1 Tax=Dalotia coriaria TaxID=877792 RepID=UPI0031F3D179